MAKVLVTDSLAPRGLEILERAEGVEVVDTPGLSPGDLLEAIRDVDALVIRSGTKVTSEVIEAGEKLSVIGRAGIGVVQVFEQDLEQPAVKSPHFIEQGPQLFLYIEIQKPDGDGGPYGQQREPPCVNQKQSDVLRLGTCR